MHRGLGHPFRFWVEVVACGFSAGLFFITLAAPDWIEAVFHIEPDNGSGLMEWGFVLATAAASVCTLILARKDWQRLEERPAAPSAGRSDG